VPARRHRCRRQPPAKAAEPQPVRSCPPIPRGQKGRHCQAARQWPAGGAGQVPGTGRDSISCSNRAHPTRGAGAPSEGASSQASKWVCHQPLRSSSSNP
jgi:hypothetical protein